MTKQNDVDDYDGDEDNYDYDDNADDDVTLNFPQHPPPRTHIICNRNVVYDHLFHT